MVKVLRVCANPRLVLCGYQEEGLERRVLVRVGRNMNFLPGMELKALRPDPNHQGGRPWQADMPDIPETGPAKPGGIFIRAVIVAVPGDHQPVQREKGRLARCGFVRLQNKVLHYDTSAERERCEASSEKVLILGPPKHVANR